ncbi:NHL repeat-containing protein [Pontibacter beigongshangensis]|uniref:hypothetical protein n=1 Tax=Pontibacter beigongshangensis TaxID=2574733 RepID=UPI001F505595|nr:hypothetical protein [Pontibacter beigongshangensis]
MIKIFFAFITILAISYYFLWDPLVQKTSAPAGLEKVSALPGEIPESSGIEVLPKSAGYLTHNDAGNKPNLYQLDKNGKLVKTIKLSLPNVDWEDLARDDEGNIYIADTGNNKNKRKELAIYKVNPKDYSKPEAIRFSYEDQKDFPPSKKEMNFDCEAVFWHAGNLYLISKDRGMKETAKIYRLSDKPGQQQAKLIGSHKIRAGITGADISPNGDKVVLLSVGRLHIFSNVKSPGKFYEGQYREVKLTGAGQTEGVAFINPESLVITSEGGNLYRYSLN